MHTVKLLRREEVARGTRAFYLEKPAGFSFRAGEYLDVRLKNPPETDAEGNTRAFSIASAPYESELMIATRMRNTAFKRVLSDLPTGSEILIDGPMGNFTLHNDAARPALFIVGGIGITPVRSIILEAAHEGAKREIVLLYSNRTREDSPFFDELETIAKRYAGFTFVPTMTDLAATDPWGGERRKIDEAFVKKHVEDISWPIYYLVGPPVMVQAMYASLGRLGVSPDDIRLEEFAGY